jgi:hypothetical protein
MASILIGRGRLGDREHTWRVNMMIKPKPTLWVFILVVLVSALSACTGPQSTTSKAATGPLPSTAVIIADFKTVAGVWEGILHGLASPRDEGDWVMLRIGADGSYEFASFREIGVFQGSGTLRLSQGQLLLETPRGGRATFTLYADNTRRLLRADAVARDGQQLTANLTPKR